MSNRMGESLNLALALEGRVKAAPENEQLVAIAEAVANLPDPEIDANFMLALEQRILTEDLGEQAQTSGRHLQAVPDTAPEAPVAEPVRRAPVVQMPSRRFAVRRSVVAMAAAASLVAFPVAAAASSLPGSPFYGLKTRIERVQLALFGTPLEDAQRHLDLVEKRLNEAEQLNGLGAAPSLIEIAIAGAESSMRAAETLVFEHATDEATLRSLGERAAEAEQRLREVRAMVSSEAEATLDIAIDTSILIQQRVDGLIGTTPDQATVTSATGTLAGTVSKSTATQKSEAKAKDDDTSKRSPAQGPGEDAPDTAKNLSEGADGCQVPGSADGMGDLLAPVARVMCT